ncbi:MAG: endonuclease/exonuclease/phosphatase family protein [Candidatus Lokiarchaeota archaeon]|nr:endonuclease/exonuclease/phosphatase family protein [Candidatus Lokiarchaeota archaeon]
MTNSVKIFTYNVQFGSNDATMDLITQVDADIVALQEVTNIIANERALSIAEYASALSYEYVAIPSELNVWDYGLIILSRYNITSTNFITIREDEVLSRGILIAELDINGTLINVINSHLDIPLRYVRRFQHVQSILDIIDYSKPLILLGDFNTPNYLIDISYWSLFSHLQDAWIASGKTPFLGKTWHVCFPFLRIDYIWINHLCTVVKHTADLVWNRSSSDHRGLMVSVTI